MGLVGGLFQPIYNGIPLVLMSPACFLQQPLRWLQLISRHRGTISGGPDFAYRLCMERITDAQVRSLDLSSWRVAFSGAEPVRHDTLQAFAERFKPAGFDARALYPCYGLAEATLFVTGGRRDSGMTMETFAPARLAKGHAVKSEQGTTLVACGSAHSRHRVRIVDTSTGARRCNGRIGEIWVSGPSVSRGYWRREAETAEAFVESNGSRWLRTGDLGFVWQKQLYITGRQKDLIILRGQNIYPQDIEHAIEARIEAVRKGRVAAFSVSTAAGEGIGVALEVSRGMQRLVPADRLVEELKIVIAEQCNESLAVAVLLNPGALPKTSSGKVQRTACREGWLHGTLDAYSIHERDGAQRLPVVRDDQSQAATATETAVAEIWRAVLQLDRMIRPAENFFALGGTGRLAFQLTRKFGLQITAGERLTLLRPSDAP